MSSPLSHADGKELIRLCRTGRLYEVLHAISRDEKKREFHLFVDLLHIETLVSRFACDVVVTKYIQR